MLVGLGLCCFGLCWFDFGLVGLFGLGWLFAFLSWLVGGFVCSFLCCDHPTSEWLVPNTRFQPVDCRNNGPLKLLLFRKKGSLDVGSNSKRFCP